MTIETKFDVGDDVCFILNSSVVFMKVRHIEANTFVSYDNKRGLSVKYIFDSSVKMFEQNVFKTKEELLASL